jgi:thymidylate synthase (FAD)
MSLTSEMPVELIDTMGDDLKVVNMARVSFAKQSVLGPDGNLRPRDMGLLEYLADHGHELPFAHCAATFRIKAPIFVARQLGKHQVGFVWSEVSRRYVDSEPEFYVPESWRKRAKSVKQGSSETEIVSVLDDIQSNPTTVYTNAIVPFLMEFYEILLGSDICPEQARMVLPQSMMTEWCWTGSLLAFARVCKLRLHPHAQKETRDVCLQIYHLMKANWPRAFDELTKEIEKRE